MTDNRTGIIDAEDSAPWPTIAERTAKGRETDRIYGGAIVPFPPGYCGENAATRLSGNERGWLERHIFAGYRPKFFEYRSEEGEILQVVMRLEHPKDVKIIRPLRYCGHFPSKGNVFSLTAIERVLPLYGLDRLAARPDAPVLVVEGEKAAEAAAKDQPGHAVISWMAGANNVRRAEMLALAGRDITLWPDNDPPGRAAMRTFAALAYEAGAASVKLVDVPKEFGPKWDLADQVPAAYAEEYPIARLLASARLVERAAVAHLATDDRKRAEQRRLLGYEPGYTTVKPEATDAALAVLDPSMFGNQWRRVARCLYYAYGERALPIFDAWSQGSDKYRAGEPTKLWEAYAKETAFRADPIAWLFRKARGVLRSRSETDADKPNVDLDQDAVVTAAIEEISEDHAVVMRGEKLGVLWEHYDPRFNRLSESYLSKRDFVDRFVTSIQLPPDHERQSKKGDKRLNQGELWFHSPQRRSFEGVYFAPGENLGPGFLNLWRGFAVESVDNPEGWGLLKQHLFEHVAAGDQPSYDYILNWLAFAVQKLNLPVGVALVLIGPKGAGKSIVTELFGHLFGPHTFVTSRMDDAIGRFNDRLETTVLLGLEEAVAPQNRAADGTLKDLVTRKTLRLEGKFFGTWTAPNHLRIIVTSNNEHVVRADGSERRYAVFDVASPYQADPDARRNYFGRIVEQMETGGYAAMLGELLQRNIREWNPEAIPETPALRRQKILNLINDPVRSFLHERLIAGDYITLGSPMTMTSSHRWSQTKDVFVPVRDLIEDFRNFAVGHGMRFSERQLAMQLPRYMPEGFKSVTMRGPTDDGSSGTFRAYPFPPLEIARAKFEEVTGLSLQRGE